MSKTRTTVTLDEEVIRAVRVKAARSGRRDSEVIEEALRRDLGLEDLEDVWARVSPATEAEGLDLANAEVHALRRERRAAGRP
jgi:Arc/MetJ-type ribon-helix-helix transcriptional regulator